MSRMVNSVGSAPNHLPYGHDERMAGRGLEQPQRGGSAAAELLPPQTRPFGIDDLEPIGDLAAGEVRLTSRAESARTARRLSLALLRQWGIPQLNDTVELLVSELVGNAVRHTGARTFGLKVTRRRGWIRVEVRDPSRALPCLLPVRDVDIGGRGLFLVDRLADRWGVDLQARGKTTWFELRVLDRVT